MSVGTGLLGLVHRLIGALQGQTESAQADIGAKVSNVPDKSPQKVFETSFPLEAEVVRGFLEANDIPAVVQREAISQVYPCTFGDLAEAGVLVPAALATQALDLLSEQKAATTEDAWPTPEDQVD